MFLENLKANLIILIFFGIVGFLGYWAVSSLQVDSKEFDSVDRNVYPILENNPEGYKDAVTAEPASVSNSRPTNPTPSVTPTPSGNNSSIKAELQKLIDDNVLMKKGSRGTRVGTVQKFLNLYNGTDATVDNDFGTTTENQIKVFQKKEGLTADGQVGSGSYKKMIEWLNKQI